MKPWALCKIFIEFVYLQKRHEANKEETTEENSETTAAEATDASVEQETGEGEEGGEGDAEGEGEEEGAEEEGDDTQGVDKATSPPPLTPHWMSRWLFVKTTLLCYQ